MTDFIGSLRGFLGRGLLEEVGGAGVEEDKPLVEGSSFIDCLLCGLESLFLAAIGHPDTA
jgi:hypothetical protein